MTNPSDVVEDGKRMMCCFVRWAFLGWLLVWLCLSAARQCFDLLGKLWALVCIDLAQILAICSAFSTMLRRPPLPHQQDGHCNLVFMATFSIASFVLNIVLFLWWCTQLLVGPEQRERLLSFGLPFGHSFFVRHSPFCSAHFNLTSHRWEQPGDCALPYSFFEGLQAILHTIFAAGTFFLAIFFAKKGRHNDRNEENPWEIEEKSAVGKSGNGGTQTNYSGYNLMDKENYVSNGRETVASGYIGSIFEQRGAIEEPTHHFSSSVTNNVDEEQQRHAIPQQRIAPIPPIRRSLPRRMEQQQQKTTSGQRGNVGSQRRTAIIGNKQSSSAPIDNTTNYSSLSTVAAAECAATIAATSNNGPGEFLALMAAANSLSSRSSCSSNSFSTQQNRRLLQQLAPNNRSQNPPPLSEFGANSIGLDRPIKGGGATSLMVSFDPKASGSELIQVRAHRRTSTSSDEEERLQGGRQNCWNNDERKEEEEMDGIKIENDGNNGVKEEQFIVADGGGTTGELGMATSLQSIPSMEAPSLFDSSTATKMPIGSMLPTSASILSHPLPPLPIIRHRVPPQNVNAIPQFVDEISQNFSDYVPSIGLLSRPLPPPATSMEMEGNIADGGLSSSIYETFLGTGPQDACTSFPVQCGAAPRQSAVQLAAVSAMRLSRHDLLAEDFGHKNKDEMAKKTQKGAMEAPPQITTQMGMLV